MRRVSLLAVLTAMVVTTVLAGGCEGEPEQTQERLEDAIGQREVQDLFREDDAEEHEDEDEDTPGER